MYSISTNSPTPRFFDLYNDTNIKQLSNVVLYIPPLPSIKSPIHKNISNLNLDILELIKELQSFQHLTTILNIIKPLVEFNGLDLQDVLPKIPGTDINLIDLLNFNPDNLYSSIATAIALNGTSIYSYVPSPMFMQLAIPDIETVCTVKLVIEQYKSMCIDTIVDLITTATNTLNIPNMNPLPSLPPLNSILNIIRANITLPLNDIFSLLSFEGFPVVTAPSSPLIPGFSSYEIEGIEGLNIYLAELIGFQLNTIIDFITTTFVNSSYIGFAFPLISFLFIPSTQVTQTNPPVPPPPPSGPGSRTAMSHPEWTGFNIIVGYL